jgi:hypothetical protein
MESLIHFEKAGSNLVTNRRSVAGAPLVLRSLLKTKSR